MGGQTRECAGCKRSVNVAIPVCPFCGRRARPSEGTAEPLPVDSARSASVSTAGAPAVGASGSARCPRCGAPAGLNPVQVEVWKGAFHWNPGVRRFNVLSRDLAGLCNECSSWLRGRRGLASLLMVAPFLALAALAGTGSVPLLMVTGLYGLHLVRAGSYGFADGMVYGSELEAVFRDRLPHHPGGDVAKETVRFPAGIVHGIGRIAVAGTFGFALALAVNVLVPAMSDREPSDEAIEELLSRPKMVWMRLAPGSEAWATTAVDGSRAASAYTSWDALPPGNAIQISPHDAFERALSDPSIEAIQFDPGPEAIVVKKSQFEDFKLRLPPWSTPVKVVNK